MTKLTCTQCGSSFPPTMRLCPKCRVALTSSTTAASSPNTPGSNPYPAHAASAHSLLPLHAQQQGQAAPAAHATASALGGGAAPLPPQKPASQKTVWILAGAAGLIILLSIVLLFLHGDRNRAAREAAQRQLAQQQMVLNDLRNKQDGIQTEIAAQEREMASQQRNADEIRQQRASQRAELGNYLSQHKLAVAAVTAAGGAAATLVSDDVKQALEENVGHGSSDAVVAAGVVGAGYCLFNGSECADVTARLTSYNIATKDTDASLERAEQNIASLQSRTSQLKQEAQDYVPRIQQAQADVDATQSTIQRLQ